MLFSFLAGGITLWTIIGLVIFLVILLAAVSVHEFAHAWTADHLGDPTPRYNDRITLDPRAHLDPLGTAALLFIGFGWGKPVPFDPYNLKDPVKDAALIALAGPASNIIMAIIISVIFAIINGIVTLPDIFSLVALAAIQINIMLAVFNLIPIYPLDGSKIAMALLPRQLAFEYEQFMQQFGTILLILLIIPLFGGISLAGQIILPIINFGTSLLVQIW